MTEYKITFSILICTCTFSLFSQEHILIKGVVSDSLNTPIPSLFISIVENQFISDYSYTNNLGVFVFNINRREHLLLNIRGIGFQKKTLDLDSIIQKNTNPISLKIILQEEPFKLNEVALNAKLPVIKKNDTISYLAESFLLGNEKSAEDLLKNIPGIEVSERGDIKVYGKPIEKIMIEGDDLFKKGYKIVSKNLDAQFVEKVEILEHYLENPLYKEIDTSNKIAINLRLKENKNPVFGSGQFSHSQDNLYLIRNNLLAIKKKMKSYIFSNLNNTGVDPSTDISHLFNLNQSNSNNTIGDHIKSEKLIQLGNFNLPYNFKNKFNDAAFISFNNIYKPLKNWKITNASYLVADEIKSFRNQFIDYDTDLNFQTLENSSIRNNYKTLNLNLSALYFKNNNRLEYQAKVIDHNVNDHSNLNMNLNQIKESLFETTRINNQKLTYSHKFKKNRLLEATGRFINNENQSTYHVEYITLDSLATQFNRQLLTNIFKFYGFESQYLIRNNNHIQRIALGISDTRKTFFNELNNTQFEFDTKKNNFNSQSINQQNFYLTISDNLAIQKFSIQSKFRILKTFNKFETITLNSIKNHLLFTSNIGFIYSMNSKNTLNGFYNYSNNTIDLNLIRNTNIQTGYRNFNTGLENIYLLKGHQVLISYERGTWNDLFHLNSYLIYQMNPNYVSHDLEINSNFIVDRSIITNNQRISHFQFDADYYFKSLKGTLKVGLSSSKFNYNNKINTIEFVNNNISTKINSQWRSTFDGYFNFNLGQKININHFNERLIKSTTHYFDIDFKISDSLLLLYENEFIKYEPNKPYTFSDIKFILTPKNKDFTFTLSINNIFNETYYIIRTINEYSISNTSYQLMPRNLMLDYSFKF